MSYQALCNIKYIGYLNSPTYRAYLPVHHAASRCASTGNFLLYALDINILTLVAFG